MILLLMLMIHDPHTNPVIIDRVDAIEINHMFDEKGKLVFDQIIFWKYEDFYGKMVVYDWRLLKIRAQLPMRNPRTNEYTTVWYDGNTLRAVHSKARNETWTLYDPELRDREVLQRTDRRLLTKPPEVRDDNGP